MTHRLETKRGKLDVLPVRIQLRRTKGWRLPEGAVRCARPGPYGNPFRVGGYFMIGDPNPRAVFRMSYCETFVRPAPSGFTLIESNEQAVEWFRRYSKGWSPEYLARVRRELAGHDLGCFCALDQPCHVDVLIELANPALPGGWVGGEG